jgi:hypothetical protein
MKSALILNDAKMTTSLTPDAGELLIMLGLTPTLYSAASASKYPEIKGLALYRPWDVATGARSHHQCN